MNKTGSKMKMYNPAHPGLILREWIDGFSVTEIAEKLGVTRVMLSRILNGKASISPEMALRISQLLGSSAELWLGMQSQYDLWQVEQRADFKIEQLVIPRKSGDNLEHYSML